MLLFSSMTLLLVHSVAGASAVKCGVCECYEGIMDCNLRNIVTLGYTAVHKDTKVLNISHNYIEAIERENFMEDFLLTMDLSSNIIKDVSPYVFSRSRSLEYLLLRRNVISSLNKNSFSGLRNLTVLDISENIISHLSPYTFQHLERVRKINLSKNQITLLFHSLFIHQRYLEDLDLSNNHITRVDLSVFPDTLNFLNLNVSTNRISILTGTTSTLSKLSKLDVSCNVLANLDVMPFIHSSSLHSINLMNNEISNIHSEFMCLMAERRVELVLANNPVKCDDILKDTETCNNGYEVIRYLKISSSIELSQGCTCKLVSQSKNLHEVVANITEKNNHEGTFTDVIHYNNHSFKLVSRSGGFLFFLTCLVFTAIIVLVLYLRIKHKMFITAERQ